MLNTVFCFCLLSGLKVCVYLMSGTVVHMDVADGRDANVQDLTQALLQEEEIGLPRTGSNLFTLWMSSSLLGERSLLKD